MNYYNEFDPKAAAWLRNLIAAGLIPAGDVDERSIEDVIPNELRGYTQCHFFAGIGGWPLALALAGWPASQPVWTGSCPCQPFSAAGKGAGFADERHLWPAWLHLISQCRPAVILGEQVANAIGHGWLDGVCADMEGQVYAIGASVLPACAIDAPHRRDRLWFVADASSERFIGRQNSSAGHNSFRAASGRKEGADRIELRSEAAHSDVADADEPCTSEERQQRSWKQCGPGRHPWARHSWIIGNDGKARRVEPSIRLLAHGIPGRLGRLRAYGNAFVPQVAAEFITAYAEARGLIL